MSKNAVNEPILYHYFERSFGPFACFTALPIDQARQILIAKRNAGHFGNPDIDGFLQKRYDGDRRLREAFIAHGGLPQRTAPIYFMLGEHRQWESAYDEPCVIRIPLSEFDRQTVSFTYGDSFAVFIPALYGEEEYRNKIYFDDEISGVIARHGYPPHVDYDFKRGIYPQDKHINDHLKYVEAHVWADDVLDRYKAKWLEENVSGGEADD